MPDKPAKPDRSDSIDDSAFFIIAYVLEIVTGIIVLLIKADDDKRLKLHSFQAIFLGIVAIVVWVLLGWIPIIGILGDAIGLLIWLYGLYVGFEAYRGNDIIIPYITEYAKRYSSYDAKTPEKPDKSNSGNE